jgi:hypothetical protein
LRRKPFSEAGQALLASGVSPATRYSMRHEDSSIISMRSSVGATAASTVVEYESGGSRIAAVH